MSRFAGILQISQSQSSVNGNILLMSGVADPNQAMSSATSFVQGKGFRNGFNIVVIGELGQVGSVSGIIMTDAVAPQVTAAAPAAMAAVTPAASATSASLAAPGRTASKKKKAPPKKKAAPKKRVVSKKAKTPTKASSKRKATRKKSNRK